MSLRNRARSLQKKTGLSYQRALAKLRALGEKPARLADQTGWPLDVCDRFLVDGHAPIDVIEVPEVRTLREQCEAVCEKLRVTANARAVVLAAKSGAILVQVGAFEVDNELADRLVAVTRLAGHHAGEDQVQGRRHLGVDRAGGGKFAAFLTLHDLDVVGAGERNLAGDEVVQGGAQGVGVAAAVGVLGG